MKIMYKTGNLLDATEPFILHGCNAQGKMNSGVAKAIRDKYPSAYNVYIASIPRGGMTLGRVTYAEQDDGHTILNGIIQEFYGYGGRQYVSYEAIKEIIKGVDFLCQKCDQRFVAMPKIGSGLGGGDWDVIAAIIEEESTHFQAVVYEL